jgi:hypothetical protein
VALDTVREEQRDQKLNMTQRQADKEQGKVKVTDRQRDMEIRKGMFGVTGNAAITLSMTIRLHIFTPQNS